VGIFLSRARTLKILACHGQQNFLISSAEIALNAAQTEPTKMLAQRDLTIIQHYLVPVLGLAS